jgi:hypothetical protein
MIFQGRLDQAESARRQKPAGANLRHPKVLLEVVY